MKAMTDNQKRVVLFADVSGSSALYKQKGNLEAKQIIDQIVDELSHLSLENNGTIVKTIGDEIMARFDDPIDAYGAACSMQKQYADNKLSIRIGMAYGQTLLDNNDVFGDTVNDAAYISHIARGRQILMNDELFYALPKSISFDCHEFDKVRIKGESHQRTIYRIDWEGNTAENAGATQLFTSKGFEDLSHNSFLTINLGEHEVTINQHQTPFKIGRTNGDEMDLQINSSMASRSHCDITFQHGKFILVDHSTNGTYVKEDGHQTVYLRREEFPLTGNGVIAIGGPVELSEDLIRYSI